MSDARFQPVESVKFNDGNNADLFAIVLKDNGGDNLNLQIIPDSGTPYVRNSVPRREKKDYDEAGGGDTWHTA